MRKRGGKELTDMIVGDVPGSAEAKGGLQERPTVAKRGL